MAALARSLGCPARRVASYEELVKALDEVIPDLAGRGNPCSSTSPCPRPRLPAVTPASRPHKEKP
nr:hypothetical protein GCM10020093_054620 [Planobispora longispora]